MSAKALASNDEILVIETPERVPLHFCPGIDRQPVPRVHVRPFLTGAYDCNRGPRWLVVDRKD